MTKSVHHRLWDSHGYDCPLTAVKQGASYFVCEAVDGYFIGAALEPLDLEIRRELEHWIVQQLRGQPA